MPNATSLIKVGNAASRLGNYDLAVTFGTVAASLSTMATGTLSATAPSATGALLVAEDQIFQFLLNVGAANAPTGVTIRVSIRDPGGREVANLATAPGGTVSGPLPLLVAGEYTVNVSARAPAGAEIPNLSFTIQGSSLSDPIGPVVVNPTTAPAAFSSRLGGMYYYFALPTPMLTANAYLMYFPGPSIKTTPPAGTKVFPVKEL